MPLLLLVAALLLAACQQPPARQVPATSAVSPAEQMLTEGGALMAQGNYVTAVEKLRQAADLEPDAIVAIGREGVDFDLFFLPPPRNSMRSGSGVMRR